MSPLDPDSVRWDGAGLVPVVVQDAADGRVLMLAHADREALDATLATGLVHFHSRSRGRLWQKGESSGNVLRVVDLAADCDGDAILATVGPAGPTCHTGTRSCFDAAADRRATATAPGPPASTPTTRPHQPQGFDWLELLWATISDRARDRPAGSYTTTLLDGGVDATARKVAEEATEVVLAAKDDAAAERSGAGGGRDTTSAALAAEAADLLYHALVLLAERQLPPASVIAELRRRHSPPPRG